MQDHLNKCTIFLLSFHLSSNLFAVTKSTPKSKDRHDRVDHPVYALYVSHMYNIYIYTNVLHTGEEWNVHVTAVVTCDMRYRLFFSNDPRHVSPTVCTRPSRLAVWIKGDETFPQQETSRFITFSLLIALATTFDPMSPCMLCICAQKPVPIVDDCRCD